MGKMAKMGDAFSGLPSLRRRAGVTVADKQQQPQQEEEEYQREQREIREAQERRKKTRDAATSLPPRFSMAKKKAKPTFGRRSGKPAAGA
jgi:hypothetical protein